MGIMIKGSEYRIISKNRVKKTENNVNEGGRS